MKVECNETCLGYISSPNQKNIIIIIIIIINILIPTKCMCHTHLNDDSAMQHIL